MKILNIYQVIGSNQTKSSGFFFDSLEYFGIKELDDFLKDAKDEKDILVRVSTPGGSLFEAVGIMDKLKASGKNITTLSEGMVASAGTIIMLAGAKRQSLENTSFLFHNARYSEDYLENATAEDYKKRALELDKSDELIKKIYSENLPEDKIQEVFELMGKEEVLTADKMLELGFITEKITVTENFKILNSIYNNNNKKNNEKMTLEEIKAKLDKIGKTIASWGGKTPKNEMFKLKDGKEIEISELKEGAETNAPDGVHELEDGTKITVAGGKITKIEAPTPTEDDKDKEIARLKAELEAVSNKAKEAENKQTELAEKVKQVTNEFETIRTAVSNFKLNDGDPMSIRSKAEYKGMSDADIAFAERQKRNRNSK